MLVPNLHRMGKKAKPSVPMTRRRLCCPDVPSCM